ncbi:MAG TPA: potassium/proton antiporter [Solirubrobacteraceae bacterium]|nr:potassium/proton antiporter [Solirubrobacteraceae bacterium]
MTDGQMLLAFGGLLVAGLIASLLAGRLRVPGLVVLLGVGMAIGTDGLGLVDFDDVELARTVGIIALVLILFEGGLAAGWPEIRPVLGPSLALAVAGTALTAVITGLAAAWLLGLTVLQGLLVGAVLSSTDGAAIFAILRGSTLRRRLARTLEGEAGFNDPVAVLLVLGFIALIQEPAYGLVDFVGELVLELGVGAVIGLAIGWLAVRALDRFTLASAGLYPVASIAIVAVAYGAADVAHGSGFLAVYLTGLAIGSSTVTAKRTIVTFHDGLAWVAQLLMFLTLGLLVFPSQIGSIALEGTVVAVVLAVVARPLATLISTVGAGFTLPERVVLGWAGLRGAVPVVLATFPLLAGVEGSESLFNLVFFVVVLSVLAQGLTFEPLARALGVTTDEAAVPMQLMEPATIRRMGAEIVEFPVAPTDAAAGRLVRELGLPREALLNVIVRGEQAIPPRGSTRIEPGDRLHVLVRQEAAVEFRDLMRRWREGPLDVRDRPRPSPGYPAVFTTRPWRSTDGDPQAPEHVDGTAVAVRLRTRRDAPGALLALEDGSFEVAGPVLARGSPGPLQDFARRRAARARTEAERAWWREVIGALAAI